MNTFQIPKIIHQIWSGIEEPLPTVFEELGKTWRNNHPEWKYILWDNEKMNTFIQEYYPQYWHIYNRFKYNIQRWDAIRYLILDKIGGMYVDFDSECLKPIEPLIKDNTCCFSIEPAEHFVAHNLSLLINNAIMLSIPEHPFMKIIIKKVFEEYPDKLFQHRNLEILETTGPLMLTYLYEEYDEKELVYLMPAKYVSPFTEKDTRNYLKGKDLHTLEKKIDNAFAVHYFLNTWSNKKN